MTHELNPDQCPDHNQNPRIPLVRLGQGDFTRDFHDEHEEEKPDGFDATLYRLTRLGLPEDMATSMIDRHGCDALNRGLDAPTEETLDNGSRWRVYRFLPLSSLRIRIDDPARPSPRVRVEPTQGYTPCGCDATTLHAELAEVEEELNALNVKTSFTLPGFPVLAKSLEVAASLSAMAGCAVWAYFGGLSAMGGLVVGCVLALAFMRMARHVRLTAPVARA